MHDSTAEMNIGQKSAQVGYTEWAINVAMFSIDVKGVDVLYVLPSKMPDCSDFSSGRFDPALELSPYLCNLFPDVKNVGHKKSGTNNLYIRGSNSRGGLKSIPVGLIVLDEVDEMDQDNIPLAMERSSGQVERMTLAISTPTIPKKGINRLYLDSTQEHFYFKCPRCSKFTELKFPECLHITAEEVNDPRVVESKLICKECKGELHHEDKWEWLQSGKMVASYTNRASRGFHVNRLYSSAAAGHPAEIAKAYLRSLRDKTEEQEFYNSQLGQTHIVEGAGLNDEDVDSCIGSYRMHPNPNYAITTLGVDQGRWLHYWVDEWVVPGNVGSSDLNIQCRPRTREIGKVLNFEELDHVMRAHKVQACVIDAQPERRNAYEFASRFYGLVKMCFYGQGVHGKQIQVGKDEEPLITVDRTSWLDLSLGRFRGKNISVPVDMPNEAKHHLKALIRIYEKDRSGNPTARYVNTEDDHYAHARNYSEIALPFALNLSESENITEEVI